MKGQPAVAVLVFPFGAHRFGPATVGDAISGCSFGAVSDNERT